MKYLLINLVFFLISCGQNSTDNRKIPKTDSSAVQVIKEPIKEIINKSKETIVEPLDLQNKMFDIGDKSHFTDSCSFYFECDCCSGNLIFNSDSSFYYKSYCVADVSFTNGQYSISNDTISLHFSGHSTTEAYNWDHEIDSSAVEYYITDTTFTPTTYNYRVELCNGKLKLINLEYKEIAIQSDNEGQLTVDEFISDPLFDNLKKLNY